LSLAALLTANFSPDTEKLPQQNIQKKKKMLKETEGKSKRVSEEQLID